jgi:hypothetical protein
MYNILVVIIFVNLLINILTEVFVEARREHHKDEAFSEDSVIYKYLKKSLINAFNMSRGRENVEYFENDNANRFEIKITDLLYQTRSFYRNRFWSRAGLNKYVAERSDGLKKLCI